MPVDPPLRLRRAMEDYSECFKELLWKVVGDRLQSRTAGLFLSGGLDSTTMAAGAAKVLRERYPDGGELDALTMTDAANPTEEEHARLAAKALGIPIHFFRWDETTMNPAWESTAASSPEPVLGPWDPGDDAELLRAGRRAPIGCSCTAKDPTTRCTSSGSRTSRICSRLGSTGACFARWPGP